MADIYLHMLFWRRLRTAEDLHPLAGEIVTRAGMAGLLGSILPSIVHMERREKRFLNRLFARNQDTQKTAAPLLIQHPHKLAYEALTNHGLAKQPLSIGVMARMGFSFGLLCHELIQHASSSAVTVEDHLRPAMERVRLHYFIDAVYPSLQQALHDIAPAETWRHWDNKNRLITWVQEAVHLSGHNDFSGEALVKQLKALATEVSDYRAKDSLPEVLEAEKEWSAEIHDSLAVETLLAIVPTMVNKLNQAAVELEKATSPQLGLERAAQALLTPDQEWVFLQPNNTSDIPVELPDTLDWYKNLRQVHFLRGRNLKPAFLVESSGNYPLPPLPVSPPKPPQQSLFEISLATLDMMPAMATQEVVLSQVINEDDTPHDDLPALPTVKNIPELPHTSGYATPMATLELSLSDIIISEEGAAIEFDSEEEIPVASQTDCTPMQESVSSPLGVSHLPPPPGVAPKPIIPTIVQGQASPPQTLTPLKPPPVTMEISIADLHIAKDRDDQS